MRIKEGTFDKFEGVVESVDEESGRVTVTVNIFGRATPVELHQDELERT